MKKSANTSANRTQQIGSTAFGVIFWLLLAVLTAGVSRAQGNVVVSMSFQAWRTTGEASFNEQKGFPNGVLDLKKGSAIPIGVTFLNGTIEFDLGLVGHGIVGLKFREQDKDNAEVLYFRPQAHCDTSTDCLQYMPIAHAGFEWDLYSQYQVAAPVRSDGWNPVRLVGSGRRMDVFINGSTKPTLSVGRLAGEKSAGVLDFHGPASLSNLTISFNKVSGLSPVAICDAECKDPRFLRDWKVSPPQKEPTEMDKALNLETGVPPHYSDLPSPSAAWRSISAEPDGLVNLTREVGSARAGSEISLVWIKTVIDSDQEQKKRVSIGWIREAWVYNNEKLVFADRNLYGVPQASKAPDGRLGLENGSFDLPLHKGRNEVVITVDDNLPGNTQHYGWGVKLRLSDLQGISKQSAIVSRKLPRSGA
jgi:hypothetical protein